MMAEPYVKIPLSGVGQGKVHLTVGAYCLQQPLNHSSGKTSDAQPVLLKATIFTHYFDSFFGVS
jgi:hypothetical protein